MPEPDFYGPCHYCGERPTPGRPHHREHFIPRCRGGTDLADNIVVACGPCNSTKGRRTVEEARTALLLRRIKWPKFAADQLAWLRARGLDLSELDNAKLYFEER